jgi:hypothetical protein
VRGPYLWHTSPTRHLKVQNFADTYEDVCATQKHNEFERQPSLSGLLQDTVRVHFVRPLRRQRSWSSSNHPEVLWRCPGRHLLCRSTPRNTRSFADNFKSHGIEMQSVQFVFPICFDFGVAKWILFAMTRNPLDRLSKWEPLTVLLEVFVPPRLNRQRLPFPPGFSLLMHSRTL